MRGEQENMLVIRQPHEEGAQHQVCAQIERPSDGLPQNLLRPWSALIRAPQIHE